MNRKNQIIAIALAGLLAATLSCVSWKTDENARGSVPPNIVVIFTDDQGYADIGVQGAKGYTTPNIDRMASEGIRFTDFYSVASLCTPSRAGLLTGCYAPRTGITKVLRPVGPLAKLGINDNELTIAEILKAKGYATACYGKWHLGHSKPFLPTRHGFDEFVGIPYSNNMIPPREGYPLLPLIENESIYELDPDQSKLTTLLTQRAVKFIEKNKDRPFFVYLPHPMPHVPLYTSKKFQGKSEQGAYGDVMMEIDWSVGEILKAIKKCGLEDNTLVIFTSDNGPWLSYGNHAGSAVPLREGKMSTFEGGFRVPCVMRWPGKLPAGKICREPASMIDLLPTFALLAGADLPSHRIDGKNIWPLMVRPTRAKSPHEALYFYYGGRLQAVRSGKWKLHFPHAYGHYEKTHIGNDGVGGKSTKMNIGLSLFDLQKDMGEQHDLSTEYPEIVARLTALGDAMRDDLGDDTTRKPGKNRRPPGQVQDGTPWW